MTSEKPQLIVVEDNQNDILLLKRIIKKLDMDLNLKWISDGEAAMEYLINGRADDAFLVLMDIKIPKFTGLEILQKVKSNEAMRNIPIVMLTTSNQPKDLETALRYGANSYMVKPSDFQEFSEMMKTVLEYWMKYNRRK